MLTEKQAQQEESMMGSSYQSSGPVGDESEDKDYGTEFEEDKSVSLL